ncbi:hypothetical protein ABT124_17900 [Streptomyces sp. NPDC001982]|uniref:hypothetical protein n=1 Tax=Streptomyces sp. NPDC001982 TaxID=3154405 RepID=UPI00332DEC6C
MAFTPRTWVVGETVTAAQLNAEIRDQFNSRFLHARKTGDTGRTNATLADDPHLTVNIEANATYDLECFLIYRGASTGDFGAAFTVPAGTAGDWSLFGPDTALAASAVTGSVRYNSGILTGTRIAGASDSTTPVAAQGIGYVVAGSTAGPFTLKWAQVTTDATATTLLTNSWMRLIRTS